MAAKYWFKQTQDPRNLDKWQVYGNATVTGYVIRSQHTENGAGDVNIVDEYNKGGYQRSDEELDLMGQMHDAYRSGDHTQLKALANQAENVFDGSRHVIAMYKVAAQRLGGA